MTRTTTGYRQALHDLGTAQKGAARSAPAYSRFVNRKIGRVLAALAVVLGLTPNAVTVVSGCFTFTGICLIALCQPSWWLGLVVTVLLVIGYAFDSADGQVARYTGRGGPAGEWLDHVVDSIKVVSLPLAVLIQWYRYDVVDDPYLFIPVVACVAASVSFFSMILTEQLRRARGVQSVAATEGRFPWLRSILMIPMDYGLACWGFVLLAAPTAFVWFYGLITAATVVYVGLSLAKWFRELAAWQST